MDRFHTIQEKGTALGWKASLSADEDMKKKGILDTLEWNTQNL